MKLLVAAMVMIWMLTMSTTVMRKMMLNVVMTMVLVVMF